MKSRLSAIISLLFVLHLSLPAAVVRHHTRKDHDRIRTEAGTFDEDYIFLGRALHFTGKTQDLVFLGKDLTFTGTTDLGLIALGEDVVVSGQSGNGVIAGCMNIQIDGNVTGTNFIGCKSALLARTGTINGDLFIGCATLQIDGKLNGNLYCGARKIVINGEVNGDVNVRSSQIVIGEQGTIRGDLIYAAKKPLSKEEQARVTGAVRPDTARGFDKEKPVSRAFMFFTWLGLFLFFVVVGSFLLFFPVFETLEKNRSQRNFWNLALWGLIPFFVLPVAILISFVLIITIPLGLLLILASMPLIFLACIIGTTLLGQYLTTIVKRKVEKRHYQFLIGALAVAIFSILPFFNVLAFLLITSLGFGIFLSFVFRKDLAR